MKPRRPFLVVLLLYVACDLALPMMPGAFVFDVEESVESLQAGRLAHPVRPIAEHLPITRISSVMVQPRVDVSRWTRPAPSASLGVVPLVPRLARGTLAAAPPSEDPH